MKTSTYRFVQKIMGEGGLRAISTLFILFLARRLGPAEFGEYSSALAFAALCGVFVDLGINAILTREIARHPENQVKIAEVSHFLKVAASLFSWILLVTLSYLLHFSPDQRYLTSCLGIVVIGQILMEYFSALLTGLEEMGWEAVLKTGSRFLAIGFGFAALISGKPLTTIVTALAAGTLAGYCLSVLIIWVRFGSFGFQIDSVYLRTLLQTSLPLFGCVFFWVLYDSQDVLLLNFFHFSQRDVGWFSAAMKVIDVLRVYPVLMMGVFFPVLSRLHTSDPKAFRQKEQRLFIFMGWSLLAIAGVSYLLAPLIITILYKGDFEPAVHLLRLLLPALVIMGLTHNQIQILIALNQERKLFTIALTTNLCNVLFSCLLLPRFGVPGVCYALVGSEIVYFLLLRGLSKRTLAKC